MAVSSAGSSVDLFDLRLAQHRFVLPPRGECFNHHPLSPRLAVLVTTLYSLRAGCVARPGKRDRDGVFLSAPVLVSYICTEHS